MINEKEIILANTSYTKKDFASIYPEEIDTVHKLTNRWDPQTSNESDPGVVLLKNDGFIGDKLNYNLDKNILEAFMPSCTQEISMRMNCDSRGYEMRYFESSEVEVNFTYNGDVFEDENVRSLYLPKYGTRLTSDNESVYFILTEDIEFKAKGDSVTKLVIQGDLETLTIAGSNSPYLIQLENLDDNNRLYFPESVVAQNGVIVYVLESAPWRRVSNLNTCPPGSPVYKFGYDSRKKLPYIQFPEDIASLIGEGLTVKYIKTEGKDGNIRANFLTKISSCEAYKVLDNSSETYSLDLGGEDPEVTVNNPSASYNGADPETIDEAYNSYKRTIGTFDTLVTCRDYANAIYNIYDVEGIFPVVSNVQVADRRDDLNYCVKMVSLDEYGPRNVNYQNIENDITAYDLCLYPLNSLTASTLDEYTKSFKPLVNSLYIQEELENSKTISHNYKTLKPGDIYTIKNKAKLNAKIVTTYKVNNYERASIIANIIQSLIENFNARKVDYGYEIPYDSILKVIQNADPRISMVSLAEPELSTYYMLANGDEVPQVSYSSTATESGVNYFNIVLTKNILSGKISLFDYDTRFKFDFNQQKIPDNEMILENLTKISSTASIKVNGDDTTEIKQQNEVIQIIGPNLVTDIPYGAYILYHFDKDVSSGQSNIVTRDTNYQLYGDDKLYIQYVDSNNNKRTKIYKSPTIIQPTGFDLVNTPNQSGGGRVQQTTEDGTETLWFQSLGAQENINTRKINKTTLGDIRYCYWIRKNSTNTLFNSSDYSGNEAEILLGDGEYFFYTDAGFNTLVSVGSGTTIRTNVPSPYPSNPDYWKAETISYSDIADKGLLALKEKWKRIILTYDGNSSGTYIDLIENNILTLVYGDSVTFSGCTFDDPAVSTKTLNNDFIQINGGQISYTLNGKEDKLEGYGISDITWKIRSRLDINAGPDKSQTLGANQTIVFSNEDATPTVSITLNDEGQTFNLSMLTQLAGNSNIDVRVSGSSDLPSLAVYDYDIVAGVDLSKRDESDFITLENINFPWFEKKTIAIPSVAGESTILSVYWIPSETKPGAVQIRGKDSSNHDVDFKYFNETHSDAYDGGKIKIVNKGLYTIQIPAGVTSITIEPALNTYGTTGNLVLDIPKLYKGTLSREFESESSSGFNPCLGISQLVDEIDDAGNVNKSTVVQDLLTKLYNYGGDSFYYGNTIDSSKIIETDDMSSPYALYDYNNVANKFVITEIELDNNYLDIDVVRSSRV